MFIKTELKGVDQLGNLIREMALGGMKNVDFLVCTHLVGQRVL